MMDLENQELRRDAWRSMQPGKLSIIRRTRPGLSLITHETLSQNVGLESDEELRSLSPNLAEEMQAFLSSLLGSPTVSP